MQGDNSKITHFKIITPPFLVCNTEKSLVPHSKNIKKTSMAYMRKSRTAADPLVNFSKTVIARYIANTSQLNDLINNTYILIQRSCFSTYHTKTHAGTQWSALSPACQVPLPCCALQPKSSKFFFSLPQECAPIFKTNHGYPPEDYTYK